MSQSANSQNGAAPKLERKGPIRLRQGIRSGMPKREPKLNSQTKTMSRTVKLTSRYPTGRFGMRNRKSYRPSGEGDGITVAVRRSIPSPEERTTRACIRQIRGASRADSTCWIGIPWPGRPLRVLNTFQAVSRTGLWMDLIRCRCQMKGIKPMGTAAREESSF